MAQALLDLSYIDEIVEELGKGEESVIPILQAIQERYRYLPEDALQQVCEKT
ncbi:MAG: NAD(P)H-dependent oxidoreductase subunit E, partial [Candidatus Thorarchaeota archaeon]